MHKIKIVIATKVSMDFSVEGYKAYKRFLDDTKDLFEYLKKSEYKKLINNSSIHYGYEGVALYFDYDNYRCSFDLNHDESWFIFYVYSKKKIISNNAISDTLLQLKYAKTESNNFYFIMPHRDSEKISYDEIYKFVKSRLDELP